jgi:hypothetical protein
LNGILIGKGRRKLVSDSDEITILKAGPGRERVAFKVLMSGKPVPTVSSSCLHIL